MVKAGTGYSYIHPTDPQFLTHVAVVLGASGGIGQVHNRQDCLSSITMVADSLSEAAVSPPEGQPFD